MQSLSTSQNAQCNGFESFFAQHGSKRPAPIEPSATPLTHQLLGAALEIAPDMLEEINTSITDANERNVTNHCNQMIMAQDGLLGLYAESNLLTKANLEAITSAPTPLQALVAMGDALDDPATNFAQCGNKAIKLTQQALSGLNMPRSLMRKVLDHPLLRFGVIEDHSTGYEKTLKWEVLCAGEFELLLLPIEHCLKGLPEEQHALFTQAVHTISYILSASGLALHASDCADLYGYETLTARCYDERMVINLEKYLYQRLDPDDLRETLTTILEDVSDAGEIDLILEYLSMYDVYEPETPDEIVECLFDDESEPDAEVLDELFSRAYVAVRWNAYEHVLVDDDDKPSLRKAKVALQSLDSTGSVIGQLNALVDCLINHEEVLEESLAIDHADECMRGSSAVIAPCNAAEFNQSGVYDVVNSLFQYGMETDELCDKFEYVPTSLDCATKGESFKGLLLANAALVYLSHIMCEAAGEESLPNNSR